MALKKKKITEKKSTTSADPKLKLAGTAASSKSGKRWDIGKIWTPKLSKHFTPISTYFIENYHRLKYPINANEFLLIVHLFKYKWDEAMPRPAIPTLAKSMMKSEQAVRAAARSLQTKGYLYRHKNRGKPNRFDFSKLFEAIEKLYDEDKAIEKEHGKTRRNQRA